MNDLLRATMRLRPDRIVVGEVRGPEALSLLKAWNTGHPGGCATVHANNARAGLTRLEQLIQEAVITVPRELIAEAVDIVIHIERVGHGRKIKEISRIEGVEAGKYLMAGID
jgi:type IV secretion system protein VirB11